MSSYSRMARSKPFLFLVGPEKCEFYIHPPLLANQSKPLNALIQGPMKEGTAQCAWLEEVDEDTFVRFMEFLYTGDYPAAEHIAMLDLNSDNSNEADVLRLIAEKGEAAEGYHSPAVSYPVAADASPEEAFEEPTAGVDSWGFSSSRKKAKKGLPTVISSPTVSIPKEETKREKAWKKFESREMNTVEHPAHIVRPNKNDWEDYTEVFLSHAKLYVLADMYDIKELRKLSLYKLHKTLCLFTLYSRRISDISYLVKYVYHNTAEKDGHIDEMRALVVEYVACNIELLLPEQLFREVLQERNTLSVDLMEQILGRLG